MPAVSVILTTYNRAHYVEQALKSVFDQTYKNYELIVVDDGSTDGTHEVLVPYMDRMNYIWQENSGSPVGAKNAGLKHCQATWVAYLDSDDIWEPRMLETRMAAAREHPNVGLIYGDCYCFQEGNVQNREVTLAPGRDNQHPERFPYEYFGNFAVAFDGVLFRRECLEKIGQLDVSGFPNADTDAIMRIALKWGTYYVDYPGVNVRIHDGYRSQSDQVAVGKAVLRFYEKILDEFPDFRLRLGGVAERAKAQRQWSLCKEYLRQQRITEAKSLLASQAKLQYLSWQSRLACRMILNMLRAAMGIETLEKSIWFIMRSVWRVLRFVHSCIRRVWSWRLLPYSSSLVRRLFWNRKSEEAFLLRGFMRTEDYYLIHDKLRSIRPRSVLDIGCGRGRYFPMYDQVKRVVAIDISEKALDRIPLDYRKDERFHIEAVPIEDFYVKEPVDLAISNMVLAHIPPSVIRKAIRRIAAVTEEVVLDENITDEAYYCFVHVYETLFKAEGFELIERRPLPHGNVLYHFRRRGKISKELSDKLYRH